MVPSSLTASRRVASMPVASNHSVFFLSGSPVTSTSGAVASESDAGSRNPSAVTKTSLLALASTPDAPNERHLGDVLLASENFGAPSGALASKRHTRTFVRRSSSAHEEVVRAARPAVRTARSRARTDGEVRARRRETTRRVRHHRPGFERICRRPPRSSSSSPPAERGPVALAVDHDVVRERVEAEVRGCPPRPSPPRVRRGVCVVKRHRAVPNLVPVALVPVRPRGDDVLGLAPPDLLRLAQGRPAAPSTVGAGPAGSIAARSAVVAYPARSRFTHARLFFPGAR